MPRPLGDMTVYRPGVPLAIVTIFTPAVFALAGAAVALHVSGAVPLWLPAALLLWILLMPVLWLALKSVRMDSGNLGVARPWQRWREMDWREIRRAEVRLGRIRVTDMVGETLAFTPRVLRDGARLERMLLLRLPADVLTGALRQRAQQLVVGAVYPTPAGGLTGLLRTRPRQRWRLGATAVVVVGAAGAALLPGALAGAAGLVAALLCGLLALVGLGASLWLGQSLLVTEHGIEVARPFRAHGRGMRWREVEMVEITSRERLLRLRATRRLLCPGPGLLAPADRNALRAFIHEYCLARNVPLIHRHWLI